MKIRTTALAAALMTASVSCLSVSAQAAPLGGWHGGSGGWHGGYGWHGGGWGPGWAGAGLGFAAGAIVGSALAAPYDDDGYYVAGYGYPDYDYGDAPGVYGYGYGYAPLDSSYEYAVAPSYGYAYGPAYPSYSVAAEPGWGYSHRRYEPYGYEQRYDYANHSRGGIYASYGTSTRTRHSASYRTGSSENRRPLYAHYQDRGETELDHPGTRTGVSRMNTGVGVGHLNARAGEMDRGRRH